MNKWCLFLCALLILVVSLMGCGTSDSRNEASAKKYLLALDEYGKGNTAKARTVCKEILEENGNFYQAKFLGAKIDFFENGPDRGETGFKDLVKEYPEYTDARIWYIRTLISKQKYSQAVDEVERALSLNSEDWRLYHLYALAADGLDRLDRRLEMLEKARMLTEEGAVAILDQAQLWYALGKEESALESLQVASVLGKRSQYITDTAAHLESLIKGNAK